MHKKIQTINSSASFELKTDKYCQVGFYTFDKYCHRVICITYFFLFGRCDSVNFLPLKAYQTDMVVLLAIKNQKILKVVDLRPW